MTREEAVAEAWAGVENRLDLFHANKADRSLDLSDGSYPGYLADATVLIGQLELRGFTVVPIETTADT